MRADRMPTRIGLVAVLLVATSACTDIENGMASVSFLNFMRESPSFDPYEATRPAPPNSVPLHSPAGDWEPTLEKPVTQAALQAFGDTLTNPLPTSDVVLERGQAVYITYCAVCHGPQGGGTGPVVGPGKFPLAPALTTPNAIGLSDGYIYAIIKAGRGLMPSYQRIPQQERWAVVSYVRQLQGQGGPGAPIPAAPADTTATGAAGAAGAAGTGAAPPPTPATPATADTAGGGQG